MHTAFHGIEHFGGVVEHRSERKFFNRARCCDDACDELALQCDRLFDPLLRRVKTFGERNLINFGGAVFVKVEALLSASGFNHHDGHVAVVEFTASDNKFEC